MEGFKVPTIPSLATTKTDKNTQDVNDVTKKPPTMENNENQESTKQPAECPYKVPNWSKKPSNQEINYKFEVLKSGQIIEEVENLQSSAIWKFGRLPENDIVLAHPTISRFHAILQYRPGVDKLNTDEEKADHGSVEGGPAEGWYIYDLDSTHGTFLNKQRIPPRVYIRIRVGHMLRLGASTRFFLLLGPIEDEEPESDLSVTELREKRLREKETAAEMKRKAADEAEERLRNEGIDWGMGEDADEETDLTHNPYASTNNEELFLDDPKKTLRGYFEREDIPLEYKCDEMSVGCFVCRVELPIDDANGRPIVAEVVHKGRKKECVVQCALEACRILDRYGVLRQANQEPLKRRTKTKDSDSDDDEFWDRTGDIARRKQRKANSNINVTLTYDDLVKQEAELVLQIKQVEADIADYQLKQRKAKAQKQAQDDTDLDGFMDQLNEDVSKLDKTEIKKLRLEQQRLQAEHLKLQRLIKIAKPYALPFAIENDSKTNDKSNASKKQLPMIGKRNQFSKFKVAKLPCAKAKTPKIYASDEEEVEDENDEQPVNEFNKIQNISTAPKQIATESSCKKPTHTIDSATATGRFQKVELEDKRNKVKGPAILPQEMQSDNIPDSVNGSDNEATNSVEIMQNSTEIKSFIKDADLTTMDHRTEDTEAQAKKRYRQRPRQRKRQDIDNDELDEHESTEKYAKFVPPPNQTGDGFTALNEKYGY